jgi:hypothetical protein
MRDKRRVLSRDFSTPEEPPRPGRAWETLESSDYTLDRELEAGDDFQPGAGFDIDEFRVATSLEGHATLPARRWRSRGVVAIEPVYSAGDHVGRRARGVDANRQSQRSKVGESRVRLLRADPPHDAVFLAVAVAVLHRQLRFADTPEASERLRHGGGLRALEILVQPFQIRVTSDEVAIARKGNGRDSRSTSLGSRRLLSRRCCQLANPIVEFDEFPLPLDVRHLGQRLLWRSKALKLAELDALLAHVPIANHDATGLHRGWAKEDRKYRQAASGLTSQNARQLLLPNEFRDEEGLRDQENGDVRLIEGRSDLVAPAASAFHIAVGPDVDETFILEHLQIWQQRYERCGVEVAVTDEDGWTAHGSPRESRRVPSLELLPNLRQGLVPRNSVGVAQQLTNGRTEGFHSARHLPR